MLRWTFSACLMLLGITQLPAAELTVSIPSGTTAITLRGSDARWQLVVSSKNDQQQVADVTQQATYRIEPAIAEVDSTGYVKPLSNGQAILTAEQAGAKCQVPLEVVGMDKTQPVDFHNQVVPIFTKLGCNGGGCHGKAAGQAGFKLSLLGFEAEDDYERLVGESRGRRLFPAVPDQSLLLLKAINDSPHGGGQRLEKDSHEYRVLRRWIASGMPLGNGKERVVTKIDITPTARQVQRGSSQQLSIIATYSDGSSEDITRTAQYESNNSDLAGVDERGFVQIRDQSGDVAVMARFQGQVAVFRASIPLGVPTESFPPARNVVDVAVFAKLKTLGIPPSNLCDDSTFVRRATLDICGRLPTPQESQAYLASTDPNKAEALVDRLLASEDYADFFARKWVLILRNKRDSAGEQFGSFAFHDWLKQSFHTNKSYDQVVRELLTASGSIESSPPLVWWREVAETEARVEDTAQLFLGQRLQCARCHHHPFEKWSQADYYQMSAFFSTVTRKEGPTPENPVFVSRVTTASAAHPKSGAKLNPTGLDAPPAVLTAADDPRHELVNWMVDSKNQFFARSLVNRYWKHFMATGIVEPEDDLRVTNPASNQELMDGLAQHFIDSKYDLKQLIRTICTSSVYRLSSEANQHNLGDSSSYSRYYPKRLQAEVLLDAIDQTVMTETKFDSMPAGVRAVQLPDTGFSSYFLDVFGRPAGTTACECERMDEATLAQSLHLLNSKEIQAKLVNDTGRAAAMNSSSQPLPELINELYMSAFSRPATPSELETASKYVTDRAANKRQAIEDVVWAIINSKEFLFNH
jgi:Protein of unknown function (DUF1549)/Protein of unknown function (DUF1553)/Bacterial Ig-like domain (group 2)